jgi:hypothetical protein
LFVSAFGVLAVMVSIFYCDNTVSHRGVEIQVNLATNFSLQVAMIAEH